VTDPLLDLLDYRRRVNEMYQAVRSERDRDPQAAHQLWRKRRDELFRSHPQSALPPEKRAAFSGLPYREYDPAFVFTAKVRSVTHESYDVDTSTGGVIRFVRFGAVDLPIGSLEVLWLDEYSGGVFLPFRDATSGKTTYGGGRYLLDTAKGADLGSSGDTLVLDFNFAYHPSCVYDPKWTCPLAPLSNRLAAAVEAGELV
jgi:uncharacterized protein (DUF1684 family)